MTKDEQRWLDASEAYALGRLHQIEAELPGLLTRAYADWRIVRTRAGWQATRRGDFLETNEPGSPRKGLFAVTAEALWVALECEDAKSGPELWSQPYGEATPPAPDGEETPEVGGTVHELWAGLAELPPESGDSGGHPASG